MATISAALSGAVRADDTRYQDYPVGSRAAELGGAFVALANEASGLTYNPAGLCDTTDLNVSVSASLYGIERQVQGSSLVVNGGTLSTATLATLNVIPSEAGSVKGEGEQTDQGSKWAYAFDVTVPSFRSYGTNQTAPIILNSQTTDRLFDAAAGGAYRIDRRWSVGAAVHFNLRLFSETEAALVTNNAAAPTVGVYDATASFQNAGLSLSLGVKDRLDHGVTLGASLETPSVRIYSGGSINIQDVVTNPSSTPNTSVSITNDSAVKSETGLPVIVRLGAAKKDDSDGWTWSSQLSLYSPVSYNRFEIDPAVAARLLLDTQVDRRFVANVNLGAEYMLAKDKAFGFGFWTDFTSAPSLDANPDGTIVAGTTTLDHVSLYGATASYSMLGAHAISRYGVTFSYGQGQVAVPEDPTGVTKPDVFTKQDVSELFLYFFIAGSFKY